MTVGFYILKQLTVSRFHSLSENLILSFSITLLNVVSGSPSDRTPDLLKGFRGGSKQAGAALGAFLIYSSLEIKIIGFAAVAFVLLFKSSISFSQVGVFQFGVLMCCWVTPSCACWSW